MRDFTGKVAVVTGGSTGIGRATVELLADRGAAVVYCSHDQPTLDDVADADGRWDSVTGVLADVRSAADLGRVVALATDRYGGVDALVCSAGIQTYGTVEDTTEQDWHTVLDINLTGMFLTAKLAVPRMRERGGGAIVNISSIQGRTPARNVVGYSVSKAGVDALTRAMAVDHAVDRIRVNSVAPGPVDTPLLRSADPRPAADVAPIVRPGGARLARPGEIAEVVAFLLGDGASYVTGTTFFADGGMFVNQAGVLIR